MGKYKVTSTDVARQAGVSQSTVSQILNHHYERFTQETIRRVLSACEELSYHLPHAPVASPSGSKVLLAVCPSYGNLHYLSLIEAMQKRALERGYSLFAYATFRNPAAEAHLAQIVQSVQAAGMCCLYQPTHAATMRQIASRLPLVYINEDSGTVNADHVEQNSWRLGQTIGEHLLKLGHIHIAYISTPFQSNQLARTKRLDGIRAAFEEANKTAEHIFSLTPEDIPARKKELSEYDTGYQLAEHVLDNGPDVTAFVGLNDMVAVGILDALTDRKLRVPQDYSVCGFDNTVVSKYKRVSLTTVENFDAQRGVEAIDLLIRKIEQGDVPDGLEPVASTVRVGYRPKLIARSSTGRARRQSYNRKYFCE